MTTRRAPADAPRALSDHTILSIVGAYTAAFVLFGLALQSPAALLGGVADIITTRDALLTDYFGVGGIGGGCVNAGLLTLGAAFVSSADRRQDYRRLGGRAVPGPGNRPFRQESRQRLGDRSRRHLYSKFRREPFASHVNTAFFGAALAPVFSEILFSTAIPITLSVPLAVATSLAI